MGMNITVEAIDRDISKLPDLPDGLGDRCEKHFFLPRYTEGSRFMHIIWECGEYHERCKGHDTHTMCSGDTLVRPANFAAVRETVRLHGLDEIWSSLLDYLEANPTAWLAYG